MTFLQLIRNDLCHPDAIEWRPGPVLHCTVCHQQASPYHYINLPSPDFFRSSHLAQAYAEWSGDEAVPLSFPLSHIEGLYDTVVVGQPLHRARKSLRLLRALNAPFVAEAAPATFEDFDTFLAEFLNILYEHPAPDASAEREALEALMQCMHDILASREAGHPFDTYFNVLVPYVQACARNWQLLDPEPQQANVARELHAQLLRSHAIRRVFGRYAIPFDVLHVMVGCYACSSDMAVVGNWAIDFLIRICRGEFYWERCADSPFVQMTHRLVRSIRDRNLYLAVVRPIRIGEVIEHYSQIWQPLHLLQRILRSKFVLRGLSSDVLDMAFLHSFPAVLFTDCADHLGFTMGYNHVFMSMNRRNGQLPRGAFKKAKQIHGVVQRFVTRVRDFDGGTGMIWNLDTVKLFFASDPDFQAEILAVIRLLVTPDKAEE